ncbi:hypothetical protein BST36_24785 [Mycolicibacterium moriokaense]|uniref:HNH nuclease domain-containing protein n=1 Tax=Mycolicibacterium moriokaense TaxID=39691 RepID=A0AAD1HIY1_9MYCO|nr:HNH endonuclease signature motif containing protein [Mycolicibacterium moriokaense]MCV7042302.1 DUF222 domain-containing protein [Mycolicibacterium moriokaense]ORB17620.1 hypothetical protein BST36_24785 [Mycolicibacterium moriokaense]BBX05076.1 hypothetical protein MMOR_60120 [Mycolicibacterium moriokaense]
MFGSEFAEADDAGLVAAIEDCSRQEAVVGARRLAAIAELMRRRVLDEGERSRWACDGWDCAAAEVAAATNVSHRKASGQMYMAEALRDHLPSVAALYFQGRLSTRVVGAITWRTQLITDDAVWAAIDTELAKRARKWGPLSEDRLESAVDALVLKFDKDALLKSRRTLRTRDFVIGDLDDETGVVTVRGRLSAADGAVMKKKVTAMVATVCEDDPRSMAERRADAVGALSNGNEHLPCLCESPACPARQKQPAPKSSVVVNVYTDQATVDTLQSAAPQRRAPAPPANAGTAMLSGTEVMPTPLLAELLRNGAKLRPLCTQEVEGEPESGYRPSAKLARFVRGRDLTCRFPGCTAPAEFCDIDHVIPYPIGPTHPSNLACLCRKHHHLKTFWAGDWELKLLPDGAAVWTSPTARTYKTYPGCRSYFPEWDTDTGELTPASESQTSTTDGGVMMPRRKRTRAQERAARIKAEREQNLNDPDPPPF